MTINLADNTPRIEYSVAQGVTQTTFAVPFEFFDDADLTVYVDGVEKTQGSDYTVTGGDGSTGEVSMSVTGGTGGSTIVLVRDIAIERTTDFTSNSINRAALNTQLDTIIGMIADLDDKASRTLQISDYEVSPTLSLPSIDARKGATLAFNESTGAVEVGPTIANVDTVAGISADIATVADSDADIIIVADNISNVNNVGSNITAVNTVSANISAVNTVHTNIAEILTVDDNATAAAASEAAAAISEANAATSETNAAVSEAAAAASETAAAASEAAAALSEANAAVSEAAAAVSETNAAISETNAATSETNASASATAAATSETNAAASEANAASSETAAAGSATAAANSASSASASADAALAALDSFDDRYLGQKASDPTVDNDGNPLVAGALYYNTTDTIMKVYDGSLWVAAYASLSGAMFGANNLSDVADAAASRTNLGLGTAATTASTDYATSAQGALADSALQSSDIGVLVQGYNASTVVDSSYVHTDNNYTTTEKNKLAGIEAGATADQTASEILAALVTVDGVGSGIDADLLDGQQGSYYYPASNPNGYTTNTGTVTSVATGGGLTGGTITGSGTISHADTSAQASVNNSGATFIQDVTLDTYGHVTGLASATITASGIGALASTNPVISSGTLTEDVYAISGTSVALEPDNGSVQTHTLTGNTTYTDAFSSGQAITLMIDDGSAYTVTWPTMTWVNNGGSAPTLATSGYTVVAIWKVGTTLYGALVGDGS